MRAKAWKHYAKMFGRPSSGKTYARRKQNIPPPEQFAGDFAKVRASRVGTLGRVEMKLGRTAEARKLLEESYAVTPSNANVAAALGEMAAKAGDEAKAMDYLVPVRLSGHAPDTANQVFEALYKKGHNGSLDALEAMLDMEYRKRFPNPVHVEAYKATEKRSDRVVLGEVFTGSGCGPCEGADVAFDAALERYARKDLAVVMYHVHIPRPDPMTTEETMARYRKYGENGVPAIAIDGKKTVGGGSRESAPRDFRGVPEGSRDGSRDGRGSHGEDRCGPAWRHSQGRRRGGRREERFQEPQGADSAAGKGNSAHWRKWRPLPSHGGARLGGVKGEGFAIDGRGKGTFRCQFRSGGDRQGHP